MAAGRRSKVRRLAPEVRKAVERMIREDKHTLREMIAALQAQFPGEELPSKSGLHRYQASFDEVTKRLREQQEIARIFVAEFGEEPDEKAGAMLAQSVMAAVNHVAMKVHGDDDVSIEDVRKLTRAASYALETTGRAAKLRADAARTARERAAEDATTAARDAGISETTIATIRERIMGVS